MMRLRPGALIVFEGPDATGKSAQYRMLKEASVNEVLGLHMPSGATPLGHDIYKLTEKHPIESGLTRQFLHLASHAAHQKLIRAELLTKAVLLDRWWWSTVAYGWLNSEEIHGRWSQQEWMSFCSRVWKGVYANVVFLLTEPHKPDKHNTEEVMAAYSLFYKEGQTDRALKAESIVKVPKGTREEMHSFVEQTLLDHKIAYHTEARESSR